MIIDTPRLRLRSWRNADRETFAAMNLHPEVMQDLGGPLSRAKSDAKLNRYMAAFDRHGFCRWAIESQDGDFLGYAGVMPVPGDHPLGSHFDIGWRLVRNVWGRDMSPRRREVRDDAFGRIGLTEVVSYTAADNGRSQRVMQRLGLQRDASRDFTASYDNVGKWCGLVWTACPAATAAE